MAKVRKPQQKPVQAGGYRRKKRGEYLLREGTAAREPVVIKKRTPLVPGIGDALTMMGLLARELDSLTKIQHSVSIDPIDGEWTLVVRGFEPPFSHFGDYPVKWIKSTYVRNPLSR